MLSKDFERIEREETMRQDADWQRQLKEAVKAPAPATMHGRAVAEADLDTGRYGAALGKPTVIGSAPIVRYTQASGPWHGPDPVPDEPPLGFAIDEMPFENWAGASPVEAEPSPPSPAQQTGAPAGATASLENLPPSQDQTSDAGASLSSDQKEQD
jgi:hypothetical protein